MYQAASANSYPWFSHSMYSGPIHSCLMYCGPMHCRSVNCFFVTESILIHWPDYLLLPASSITGFFAAWCLTDQNKVNQRTVNGVHTECPPWIQPTESDQFYILFQNKVQPFRYSQAASACG